MAGCLGLQVEICNELVHQNQVFVGLGAELFSFSLLGSQVGFRCLGWNRDIEAGRKHKTRVRLKFLGD